MKNEEQAHWEDECQKDMENLKGDIARLTSLLE